MLAFKQLKIAVGKRKLFAIDELALNKGIVALVGKNGAGKSTFFRAIMGFHSEYTGDILLNDKLVIDFSKNELAKKIAIVYSKSTVFGNHTGRDVLMIGRLPYQNALAKNTGVDNAKVNEVIELLQLGSFVERNFSFLSDGEKQLIMIGRAMVQDTQIILLDEPGAFLDIVNRHRLMTVLKQIVKSTGKLILFSTHEMGFLEQVCDAVLLIEKNHVKKLTNKAEFVNEIYKSFEIKIGDNEV